MRTVNRIYRNRNPIFVKKDATGHYPHSQQAHQRDLPNKRKTKKENRMRVCERREREIVNNVNIKQPKI